MEGVILSCYYFHVYHGICFSCDILVDINLDISVSKSKIFEPKIRIENMIDCVLDLIQVDDYRI
jgi:hypothetical protein